MQVATLRRLSICMAERSSLLLEQFLFDLWSTKLTYLAIVGAAVSVLCIITLVSSVLIHSLGQVK